MTSLAGAERYGASNGNEVGRGQTTWNLEDCLVDFGLKRKTHGKSLMAFVTVVGMISFDFHFSWDGDRKGGRERVAACIGRCIRLLLQ